MSNVSDTTEKDLMELSFKVEYGFKTMNDSISLFVQSTKERADLQDERMDCFQKELQGIKDGKTTTSSLSPKVILIICLVACIAFLGALGAAIGVNLLEYMPKGGA
jgi:hypothetical protein